MPEIRDQVGSTVKRRFANAEMGERAGSNMRKLIIQLLRDNRIDILGEIPASKHEFVRLFNLDLPSGDLYADLQKPGIEQDERLRELIDRDCRQKLRQIRAIVS
jgi:hypothetical protein